MPGRTSRLSPATSSSAGSRMPSRRRLEIAAYAGHRRNSRKASGGPAAGQAANTASATADRTRRLVKSFDELVDEAAAAPVDGWDFSWLDGRATEQRPSWGYQRLLGGRLAAATAALDIQTGGGEVLA